jgi:polysaccharide biosynthesis protein PslJ
MTASAIDVRSERQSRPSRLRPIGLLTCYLILLMAIPQALQFAPLGGVGEPSTIFAAVIFGWYLLAWLHPASALDRGRQPMRLVAVLWLCTVVATYVSANLTVLPTLELNGADRGTLFAFGWLGILLLAADGIDTMDRLKKLLRRIVFGATGMAALGITQFYTGLDAAKYIIIPGLSTQHLYTDLLGRNSFRRPAATAAHPLEFAAILAICLPLAIHQARYAPPRLRPRRWLQVALIGFALPMTVSRTAILGLVVVGLAIFPTWPRRDRHLAYLVTFTSALVMEAAIPGLLGTIRGLFLGISTDSSAQERNAAFKLAAPIISHHPLLGQGFGTLLPQTSFFTDDQYLNSLIQLGFIGLFAQFALFLTGWSIARSARRLSGDDELRDLAQCMAASVAVAAVSYATFDALSFDIAAGLTFLLLGCIGALGRLMRAEGAWPDVSVRPPPRISSIVGL